MAVEKNSTLLEIARKPECYVQQLLLELRLNQDAFFHFLHGGALRGLLSRALGQHELPRGLAPVPCESGRTRFASGDRYRLGLFCCGRFDDGWQELARKLTGAIAHHGLATIPPPLPTLGGNFELTSQRRVDLTPVADQLGKLLHLDSITLQFVTPLRLERPEALKRKGTSFFDAGSFDTAHFFERLASRMLFLASGRYPRHSELRAALPGAPPSAEPLANRLLWVDLPVSGTEEKGHAYTLGGALGQVTIPRPSDEWLEILVAGQDLLAGKSTHYGFGRYLILETERLADDPFRPTRSFLDDTRSRERLRRALDDTLRESEAAGIDGETPDTFADETDHRLTELADLVGSQRYRASPLYGFLIPKPDGGVRPLAIPTVRDRVLQRAAADALYRSIDALLEDCSFAYRKGLSRAGAARAIQQAWRDGFRWVLDADIEAFFDRVSWDILLGKLHALFPHEPLLSTLAAWLRAPVIFQGRTIHRQRGLPQGSPISPLLANLYLDELDEQINKIDPEEFRLVRYADDFVVLCKSVERARDAQARVHKELQDLGLRLDAEKTAIRSLETGFTYLGYLFCRSLALESRRIDSDLEAPRALVPADVPEGTWLAQVPFERIERIMEQRRSAANDETQGDLEDHRRSLAFESKPDALPVYVVSPDVLLHLSRRSLVIRAKDEPPRKVPLRDVAHLTLFGRTRTTLPLLRSLAQHGIPTYCCQPSGALQAVLAPFQPDWPLWLAQAKLALDDAKRLSFARSLVAARLQNLAALCVRFDLGDASASAEELRRLADSAPGRETPGALRGVEGSGTRVFYQALRNSLDPEWRFDGRRKRPPPDPINAMLSYGQTLLHHHCATALVEAGLNPRIGLYHEQRGAHQALASDLQEQVRHLVEALVWSLASRNEVEPADFDSTPSRPCRMTRSLRRRFLKAFEERMHTLFTPPHIPLSRATANEGGAETPPERITYRQFLYRLARHLRAFTLAEIDSYTAFNISR